MILCSCYSRALTIEGLNLAKLISFRAERPNLVWHLVVYIKFGNATYSILNWPATPPIILHVPHTHKCTHAHTHTHTYVYAHMHTPINTHAHTHTHTGIYVETELILLKMKPLLGTTCSAYNFCEFYWEGKRDSCMGLGMRTVDSQLIYWPLANTC